jgi:hypothetical protein
MIRPCTNDSLVQGWIKTISSYLEYCDPLSRRRTMIANPTRKLLKPFVKDVNSRELERVIDKLTDLDELHKEFLKNRWLHQVVWWSTCARSSYRTHYLLRGIVVVGGVILPTLMSSNISSMSQSNLTIIPWITFGLGLLVALSAALEGIFHFGDIWREEQHTVDLLLIEGWGFFQLSGPYANKKSHSEAYTKFATQVEAIIQREVENYMTALRDPKNETEGIALSSQNAMGN